MGCQAADIGMCRLERQKKGREGRCKCPSCGLVRFYPGMPKLFFTYFTEILAHEVGVWLRRGKGYIGRGRSLPLLSHLLFF